MPFLDVQKVSKRYRIGRRTPRDLWAVRDVSFTLERGSILGVIGPNGAGKTTLLKVLSRVTPPTEGRVIGHGRVVPLLGLGATFQPDLSARENILMNAAMFGVSARDAEGRLDAIQEFAGVGDFLELPLKRFSSGMDMRLAFSVAINMKPDLLLADEVLAVGDLEFQERCLARVQQEGRAGMAVIFVSHDMAAVQRLCDRVIWLNAGEIAQMGEPAEVISAYENAAWAVAGRRAKDKRSGSHRNDHGEIAFVRLTSAEGHEIGAARVSEEINLAVGIRMQRGPMVLRPRLQLGARGQIVFKTQPRDYMHITEAGVYTLRVSLPSNLLAPRVYSVSCDVLMFDSEPAPGASRLPDASLHAENALSFQVFDPDTSQKDSAEGLVAPRLPWAVVKER
jgi:ABC-type polysaccharide/polyol phosphate transport system ATPase subunit